MEENLSKSEQERQARLAASQRRKHKKVIIWLVVLGIIVVAGYWLINYSRTRQERKPGEQIPEMGVNHISIGEEHEPYNSNPPTSGPHYAQPANWGIYEEQLADEQLVHNLEHGGIWISYRDPAHQDLVAQLKDIADDYTIKVILTYRPQNDSAIAVAAWGRLLKLEQVDRQQIVDFIKAFINKGPEQVPF